MFCNVSIFKNKSVQVTQKVQSAQTMGTAGSNSPIQSSRMDIAINHYQFAISPYRVALNIFFLPENNLFMKILFR